MIVGIDPGIHGAFVGITGDGKICKFGIMPLEEFKGKDCKDVGETESLVSVPGIINLLLGEFALSSSDTLFLEKPLSYGMLPGSAFTYGKNFGLLEYALRQTKLNYKYVEARDWHKHMCREVDKKLKTKEQSKLVFDTLYPQYTFGKIPKVKFIGLMDAALIARYGLGVLHGNT